MAGGWADACVQYQVLCCLFESPLVCWSAGTFVHPERTLSGVIYATGAYSCDRLIANPGPLSGVICLLTKGQAAVSKQGTLSRPSRTSTDSKLYLQLD